jgi:putative endonuclease
MPQAKSLGKWGEEQAAVFVQSKGYTILARNVHTPYGEIDLVTEVGNTPPVQLEIKPNATTAFIEVKTRRSRTFGYPEVSITTKKLEHMRLSAEYYINQHPEMQGDWRVDVISVEWYRAGEKPVITHFENIQVS